MQLRLMACGDPFAVSICQCVACRRRTGSAFRMQAALEPDQLQVVGRYSDFARVSDEADRNARTRRSSSVAALRS
jgi:hypothetical protein